MKPDRILKQGIVLYLRVSSDDKQNPANSFEYQRQRIQEQLDRSGLELKILGEYTDVLSGRNSNRTGFLRLMADARAGLFSHLAVYSIDRLGRSTEETLSTVREAIDLGVEIIVADSPDLALATPSGSLLLGMRAVIAQYEVEMLSQRVTDTKKSILRGGGWPNTLPDGYIRVRERFGRSRAADQIVFDEPRANMWREAWGLLLTGKHSLEDICTILHKRGYTRRSGKPWTWEQSGSEQRYAAISHMHRTFHMPFYAGWIISAQHNIKRGDIRGVWEPLVTDEEFDQGVEILRKKDENKVRRKRNTYLLAGLLYMKVED